MPSAVIGDRSRERFNEPGSKRFEVDNLPWRTACRSTMTGPLRREMGFNVPGGKHFQVDNLPCVTACRSSVTGPLDTRVALQRISQTCVI
jgi:hypothetical protein